MKIYMQETKSYNPPDKRKRPSYVPSITDDKTKTIAKKETIADPFIKSIITSVSKTNIGAWINTLASFHTRHTKSIFIDKVANWIKEELEKNGQTDIRFHNYTESGYDLKNVIYTKQGSSNNMILVCGHYDSRMEDLEDSESRAPGADDNASGIAVILEVARLLSQVQLQNTIQLAFFSGEEQGLWGSKHYSKYLKDNDISLYRLINLDMVGYPPLGKHIITIERDTGNIVSSNDRESEEFSQIMEEIAKTYTDLDIRQGPIYDSDYTPFEALGYVAIGGYDEGATYENIHYHSSTDEPSFVNIEYVTSVAKMVLATVLKESKASSIS
jgi:Zn-dependent M28 family amino/carboxypeptidase